MVAISTLVFTVAGIALGSYFLNKEFLISSLEIVNSANTFYKTLWNKAFKHKSEFKLFDK